MTERGQGVSADDADAEAASNGAVANDAATVAINEASGDTVAVPWCLYLIECRNGAYYAGITNKLDARYAAHLAGRGARYTRANPPVRLLGARWFADRSAAARAEWQIRQLSRERKLAFLAVEEVVGEV